MSNTTTTATTTITATPTPATFSIRTNTTNSDPFTLEKPNHLIDLELKELLCSFEPSFLGTWLYTPCDCLFPCLNDSINGVIQVTIPFFYLNELNNPKLRVCAIWGSQIYTDDSDIVTMLYHSGYLPKTSDPLPPFDVLVKLRVYPTLVTYPSTSFNGIQSRSWTQHDGVSICIENVQLVPVGTAIKKASRRSRKVMLDYRLKGYQYIVHQRKRFMSLEDATFVYDTSGTRRMVYSSQLAPFLENKSFILEAKDQSNSKKFLISPNHPTASDTTQPTTYSLTDVSTSSPSSFVYLTSFVWSDITFHSHGILIMASSPSTTTLTSSSTLETKMLPTTQIPSSSSSSSSCLNDFKKPIVIHVDWVWLPTSSTSVSCKNDEFET